MVETRCGNNGESHEANTASTHAQIPNRDVAVYRYHFGPVESKTGVVVPNTARGLFEDSGDDDLRYTSRKRSILRDVGVLKGRLRRQCASYLGWSLREGGARFLARQHLYEDHAKAKDITWQPVLFGEQNLWRHKLRRSRAEVLPPAANAHRANKINDSTRAK